MKFPPAAWDEFDAYIFDIDGTLLHCRDAVHYFAFCETLSEIAGRPLTLEGVTAHGNTDIGILRDALSLAGIADERWRPRLREIRAAMAERVRARSSELCVETLPHVRSVLEHLRSRGAIPGIATGNLRAIGETKLARAGLLDYFSFAAWSDDCEHRADIFRAAAANARLLAGAKASVCAVGDTPADIAAARANGIPILTVATGIYSAEQLRAGRPDWCVGCLTELVVPASGFAA